MALFDWTFSVEPDKGDGRYQYVWCLAKLGRWADARREALASLHLVPPRDSRLMRAAIQESGRQLKMMK